MSAPTIREVADMAGVSITAVSLYLNERPGVSSQTRERIAQAVSKLGYIPKVGVRRSPANGKFVGILMEKLPLYSDNFYAEVLHSMQVEASQLGFHLVFGILDNTQSELPLMVMEQNIAGIIVLGGGDITDEYIDRLAEEQQLVLLDNESWLNDFNCILGDNHRGSYLATRHLIEMGHQRIGIIKGPEKYKTLEERFHGYLAALADAHLPITQSFIQPSISHGVSRKGYLEMEQLLNLENPPTAVFATSDRAAFGAMDAIRDRGLRIPEDISIIGFDNAETSEHTNPPLTTVSFDKKAMGVLTVRRMQEIITGKSIEPCKAVISARLIVRGSTDKFRS